MSSETTTTSEDGSSPTAASSAESMAAGAPARSDTEDSSAEPLPPMTTEWNVPQSCTWTYNAASEPVPGATGAVAWLDLEPDAEATTLSCYPDGMFKGERTGVFSPGTCPSGWTTAEVLVNTDEDHDHATTTAICCSSYVKPCPIPHRDSDLSIGNIPWSIPYASDLFQRFWPCRYHTTRQPVHTKCFPTIRQHYTAQPSLCIP